MAPRDIELDPRFFVPPGVIDVRQENNENTDYIYAANPEIIADGGPVLERSDSPIPNAPSGYRIVSQKLRTAPDGRVVVDVELEFPNIGVYGIDVRTTPA